MKTRPILHPSDFSAASRPAFRKALEMAKAMRAPLLVTHVFDVAVPIVGDEVYLRRPSYIELVKAARASAAKRLARLVAEARRARVCARAQLVQGRPAEGIVRLARARHAGMIVMGTHGRSGLTRLLLGSIAARVVATAKNPVLTVPSASRAA
jgi:nucleotide-binding universal stress UspA family protein